MREGDVIMTNQEWRFKLHHMSNVKIKCKNGYTTEGQLSELHEAYITIDESCAFGDIVAVYYNEILDIVELQE